LERQFRRHLPSRHALLSRLELRLALLAGYNVSGVFAFLMSYVTGSSGRAKLAH
jgi:hypothetical protein